MLSSSFRCHQVKKNVDLIIKRVIGKERNIAKENVGKRVKEKRLTRRKGFVNQNPAGGLEFYLFKLLTFILLKRTTPVFFYPYILMSPFLSPSFIQFAAISLALKVFHSLVICLIRSSISLALVLVASSSIPIERCCPPRIS